MVFEEPICVVMQGNNILGVVDDEYSVCDLFDNDDWMDDPIIQVRQIDVNRFFYDYHMYVNDKENEVHILCNNNSCCHEAVQHLNKMQLEKERLEAKIRASEL